VSDAAVITARAQGADEVLAASPKLAYWVARAIESHHKPSWASGSGAEEVYASYYTAMAYWALHKLFVTGLAAGGRSTPAGPIQSKRTGDVSVTYAIAATPNAVLSTDGDYSRSPWGILYLEYRGRLAQGVAGVY
jgi:hypothetical protein